MAKKTLRYFSLRQRIGNLLLRQLGGDVAGVVFEAVLHFQGYKLAAHIRLDAGRVRHASQDRPSRIIADYSGQLGFSSGNKKTLFSREKQGFGPENQRVEEGIRTPDPQNHNLMPESSNQQDLQGLTDSASTHYVKHLAICLQKYPELAALIERWESLPESDRTQIIELAGASGWNP